MKILGFSIYGPRQEFAVIFRKKVDVLFQMNIGLWGRIPAVSNLAPELWIFPVFGLVPPPKRKNGKMKAFCLEIVRAAQKWPPMPFENFLGSLEYVKTWDFDISPSLKF